MVMKPGTLSFVELPDAALQRQEVQKEHGAGFKSPAADLGGFAANSLLPTRRPRCLGLLFTALPTLASSGHRAWRCDGRAPLLGMDPGRFPVWVFRTRQNAVATPRLQAE